MKRKRAAPGVCKSEGRPRIGNTAKKKKEKKRKRKARIFFFSSRETSPRVQEMSTTFHLHMVQLENMEMVCGLCQALEMNLHKPHNPQNGSPGIFEFHFV